MCVPAFSVVSQDGGEMQQSSLSQGEGLVAGPAAGTMEASGESPAMAGTDEPSAQTTESDPTVATEGSAEDDPANEPGAEVEVAPAVREGFF